MKAILRFYLPLALPAVLVGFSHAIISWVLTRMPNPTLVLSAYALAAGIAQLGEAPIIAARQAAMTLIKSQHSWRTVRTIAWGAALLILVLEGLTAWGPLSRPILHGIFRVPEHLLDPTRTVFQAYLLLVAVSTWRFLHQGVLIGHKRPLYVTAGMVIRLPFQLLLAYGAVHLGWLPPLLAGPVILLSAILVEAVVAFVGSRRVLPTLPAEDPPEAAVSTRSGLQFFLPLAASFGMYALGRPAINAAVSETPHAEPALATLSIIYILFFVFLGPLQAIHQVAVVFPRERRTTLRFALSAGLLSSLLLVMLGFTVSGNQLLVLLFEVPEHLQATLVAAVRTMAVWPILFTFGDYLQGVLLAERNTRPISLAKLAGVLVSVGVVRLLVGTAATPPAAAAIAVAGMAVGAGAETLVMFGLRLIAGGGGWRTMQG